MKYFSAILFLVLFINQPVCSQAQDDGAPLLNLPGDNLDLYAVLTLFQKSKTIESFEKSLNEEQTKINNLDLNVDGKVDFIKVESKKEDGDFIFVLQVDVTEKEKQDVAVILVSKDKNGKVSLQIVGDKDLYGENYVVEPQPAAPPVTPNPGYSGPKPIVVTTPAPATVIVVESAPIVQYVYSPVYVPYYPPYYYGFYPPYFAAFTVMAIGIYHHNNYYYHAGYHGGHGHTVVVHHSTHYNHYHQTRHSSTTVSHHNSNGSYKNTNASVSHRSSANSYNTNRTPGNSANNNKASSNSLNNNKASANSLSNNRSSTNNAGNNKAYTSATTQTSGTRSGGGRSMNGGSRSGGGGRRR